MKKGLVLMLAISVVLTFLLSNDIAFSFENIKIDASLYDRCKNGQTAEIFVELTNDCVVQALTLNGAVPMTLPELMKTSNLGRKIALQSIVNQQSYVKVKINEIIGVEPCVFIQYLSNGFICQANIAQINQIAGMQDVKRISCLTPKNLHRFVSRSYIKSDKVYSDIKDANGKMVDGSGVLVGVTDTGLDYTHQDFGSQKNPVGDKVVISRDLADGDDDCQEILKKTSHGTACAGIIAGDGPGNEKGIAPKAKLAGYKISYSKFNGRLSNFAVIESFEYLVKDGIQVSNNSYGAIYGSSDCPESKMINNAVLAGCVFIASQGNSGSPGPGFLYPGGDISAPDNAISVGASDETIYSPMIINDSPTKSFKERKIIGNWGATGKKFEKFETPIQVVDCGWGRTEDFDKVDVKGKAALISRGPGEDLKLDFGPAISFKDKCLNASKAGAEVAIIYNNDSGRIGSTYAGGGKDGKNDPNLIPSYELFRADGELLRKELHGDNIIALGVLDNNQEKVTISFTKPENMATVSSFSSIGPTSDLKLKPDVCAPGVNVRSTSPGWTGQKYIDDFTGTSGSGPFVAGCAALMIQARPSWNPLEVKRALMNTATLLKRLDNDRYFQFTAQGMGRVNVYDAIKTDVLIQPPSALIVAETGKINIADIPAEIKDTTKRSTLPDEVSESMLPLKFYNYSTKKDKNYSLSFELNSRHPEQIKIEFTKDTIAIPKAKDSSRPGTEWVGVDIAFPAQIKGLFNDVIIFATDKETGEKLHIGVCIYSGDPVKNTCVSDVEVSKEPFTPNADGNDDMLNIKFTISNGSIIYYSAREYEYSNLAASVNFYAIDYNLQKWVRIFEGNFMELGHYSINWDGKNELGEYALPNGNWHFQMVTTHAYYDRNKGGFVPFSYELTLFKQPIKVENSLALPAPTIFASLKPFEPGIGDNFDLDVYLKNASNVKLVKFKIDLSIAKDVSKYIKCEVGDFFAKNDSHLISNFGYDYDKNILSVVLHRSDEGITGDGLIMKVKFKATDSNYVDIDFSNMKVIVVDPKDPKHKEKSSNAFYNNASVAIQKKSYSRMDFNRDDYVDGKDLEIISSVVGLKRGDKNYNWRCDLNYDGAVDYNDFAIFAKEY